MFKIHNTGYLVEDNDSSGHSSKALVDMAECPSNARALDFIMGGTKVLQRGPLQPRQCSHTAPSKPLRFDQLFKRLFWPLLSACLPAF